MDVTIYRMCRASLATDKRYVIRKNAERIAQFELLYETTRKAEATLIALLATSATAT